MGEPVTAVLLISCADQKGLVASVSDFLYRNGGNIVHADQHTDHEEGVFLQRVEWETDGFAVERAGIADAFRPVAERFGMQWRIHFSDEVPRVAILASKMQHCLLDLLSRWRLGELGCEIPLVISNHDDARENVEALGTKYVHEPVTPETKDAQEQRIVDTSSARASTSSSWRATCRCSVTRFVRRYREPHH